MFYLSFLNKENVFKVEYIQERWCIDIKTNQQGMIYYKNGNITKPYSRVRTSNDQIPYVISYVDLYLYDGGYINQIKRQNSDIVKDLFYAETLK